MQLIVNKMTRKKNEIRSCGSGKNHITVERKTEGETPMNERLIYEILSVVEEIPEGKVASYGQIAKLIGRDKNARLVGKVLSMAEWYGKYPCHRVVNHAGRTAPGWSDQRWLLEEEGVEFKENGCVDMKKYGWEG